MPTDWNRTARRRWPKAEWISGNGQYATIAPCGVLTVMLHRSLERAWSAKRFIDDCGCGHLCPDRSLRPLKHQIIDLETNEIPAPLPPRFNILAAG